MFLRFLFFYMFFFVVVVVVFPLKKSCLREIQWLKYISSGFLDVWRPGKSRRSKWYCGHLDVLEMPCAENKCSKARVSRKCPTCCSSSACMVGACWVNQALPGSTRLTVHVQLIIGTQAPRWGKHQMKCVAAIDHFSLCACSRRKKKKNNKTVFPFVVLRRWWERVAPNRERVFKLHLLDKRKHVYHLPDLFSSMKLLSALPWYSICSGPTLVYSFKAVPAELSVSNIFMAVDTELWNGGGCMRTFLALLSIILCLSIAIIRKVMHLL